MEPIKTCVACLTDIPAAAARCHRCQARQTERAALHRGAPGRLLGGVCGGIAQQLEVDRTWVRLAFAVAFLFSGGLVFSVYVLLWVLTPPSPAGRSPAIRFMDWVSGIGGASGQPVEERR